MKTLLASLIIVASLTACGKSTTPQEQVSTKITSFTAGGFGLVMIADFSITNNTNKTVKDIKVKCVGLSETGTKIDSNTRVIYKTVPAGKTVAIKEFNMGYIATDVQSSRCSTTDFTEV
jgi:ABC-type glycerol-3-phosphate transport system substrate-binding protein